MIRDAKGRYVRGDLSAGHGATADGCPACAALRDQYGAAEGAIIGARIHRNESMGGAYDRLARALIKADKHRRA
jgi:hypothetical protein